MWSGKMASPIVGTVSCEWRGYTGHAGIDIAAPTGTPVYAAYSGTVEKAGTAVVAGRSGKGIVVRNADREAQYYGHLNSISVAVGQLVAQGQLIGYSGATGNVTCPHLHFATRLENEIQRHRRYGTTFSVAAIEIGDFERLALRTGVSGGIPLLARVGRLLVATLREIDIVTHHREGEFHVVLPNVGLGEAHAGLERLRAIVESQSFSDLDQHMTLCGGIVEYAGETAAALFERCRLQLAQARTTSLRGFSVDRELL